MISAKRAWCGVSCHLLLAVAVAALLAGLVVRLPGPLAMAAEDQSAEKDAAADAARQKAATDEEKAAALEKDVTQGALRIVKQDGTVVECPLKHTDVKADVAGFVARVSVTQTFHNPTKEKIEAVYVFPLPHEAAVDQMTMVIGDRKVVGIIKRRAEARQIYEQALAAGQTAALLEQERPNIFTQSVGNIEPNQDINIEISYVDVLRYDMGTYEFQFPMVVGPRYIPGAPISSPPETPRELTGKVSPPVPDTTRVPDASRISPPVLKPGVRNGHDISLSVKLDAGVPIQDLRISNHQADVQRDGERRATIKLSAADSVPNKDFVLRYDVVGAKPEMAVLAHTGNYTDSRRLGSGYFMLMIQPQEDERLKKSPPREIVFLVDVSGSMSGQPTAKVIDAMQSMLKLCREQDTVQVVTFANQANKLFERPVPVNDANIKKALNFTEGLRGGGGTEMLKGVQMAIDEPIDKQRIRIVVMLTDGYIGNEAEIIEHVGKHCGDQIRFWCIGIGSSPNMFLVDGVARQGGGMGKQLGLNDDTTALTQEVMTRIQRAQLAKIKIDWGNLQVAETYPAQIPELWAGRPVILLGRYRDGGDAKITVQGNVEGEDVSWPLAVTLPKSQEQHDVLAKIWARRKIEELMQQTYYQGSPAVEEEVTALALDYKLMSQYTSFVAVDEKDADKQQPAAQPPRRMLVPVPLPEGTQWEGFFGPQGEQPDREADRAIPLVLSRTENLRKLSAEPASLLSRSGVAGRNQAVDRLGRGLSLGGVGGAMPASGPVAGNRFAMPALQQAGQARSYYFKQDASGVRGRAALGTVRSKSISRYGGASSYGSAAGGLGGSGGGFGGGGFGGYSANGRVAGLAGKPTTANFGLGLEAAQDTFAEGESLAFDYTAAALATKAEPLVKAAQAAQKTGQDARGKGNLDAARTALQRAFFFDNAAVYVGASDGQIAADCVNSLEEIHAERVEAWRKQVPALDKKLDLVLRNQSLAEAIDAVSKAANLKMRIVPGSLDDIAKLVAPDSQRVAYLDLRGATAAQALDWILLPARLTWQANGNEVVAATQRRLVGGSAWVYDVSVIALPDAQSLAKLNDYEKATAEAQKAADEFLKVVREQLKPVNDLSVTWYAPGQLLVVGTPQTHATAAKLLADLADTNAKLTGAAAELQKVTSKRASDRKDEVAKREAAARQLSVAAAHQANGWPLLAAAAAGQLDLEALTGLQIAWQDPATAELLKGDSAAIVLRSLWIVTEAAKAIDADDSELAALAKAARAQSQSAATEALAALAEKPDDPAIYGRALFAALAMRDDAAYVAKALPLLTKKRESDSPLTTAATLAKSLLSEPDEIDSAALVSLLDSDIYGEDLVVLAALACHRAGGEPWSAFRSASNELLGEQPLAGHVVVLISRLSGSPLELARRE